jgi:hypothetical protein
MELRTLRTTVLAGGLAFIASGPALAQQQQECAQRLDRVEQQLSQVQLEAQRQSDIKEVIEGARLLADIGDQEGCMNVVAELDRLMTTLDEAGRSKTVQGQHGAQPPAAAGQQSQEQKENPLAAMPAGDVIGAEVQNQEGDTVAEIVDLVKREDGEDLFAVLSVGGFLGVGDKKVVVPVNELEVGQEGQIVMAAASEEQLKDMPEYQADGFDSTVPAEQPPARRQ